jgi:hypothetical protein
MIPEVKNQLIPSPPLVISSEQDLLKMVQQNIVDHNISEAIKNLFLLLPDVTDTLPLQTLYFYLFKVIPHLEDKDFAKLLTHLPKLLALSPNLDTEQRELTLSLASRYIAQAKTLPLNIRFTLYFQAMDLFAKAIQIATCSKDHLLIKEMHQFASRLILESYLAIENFQIKLEQARREGKPEVVASLLDLLNQLKAFCCNEEDKTLIKKFYLKARDLLENIPASQTEQYHQHRKMVREGLTQSFDLPLIFPTQKYWQGLHDYRISFSNNFTDMRNFQNTTIQRFKEFFSTLAQ